MKLMIYNILNGAVDELEKILSVVNLESPDFLAINEANGFQKDNHKILKQFAAKAGFDYFDLAECGDGDEYHVAVFSKYPFESIRYLDGFARAAIAVEIKTEVGVVSIIATHLTPYSEPERLCEVEKILAHSPDSTHKVLMGDLNSLSRADKYDPAMVFAFNAVQTKKFTAKERLLFDVTDKLLAASYVDPAVIMEKQDVFTAPTSINEFRAHSNMRLDYILLSTELAKQLTDYKVIKDATTEVASDHYPVIVELQ